MPTRLITAADLPTIRQWIATLPDDSVMLKIIRDGSSNLANLIGAVDIAAGQAQAVAIVEPRPSLNRVIGWGIWARPGLGPVTAGRAGIRACLLVFQEAQIRAPLLTELRGTGWETSLGAQIIGRAGATVVQRWPARNAVTMSGNLPAMIAVLRTL